MTSRMIETIRVVVVDHSHVGKIMLDRLFASSVFEDRCDPSISPEFHYKTLPNLAPNC